MKASRAYITSLGTTGLLLCFALLLLVVVSALTAFRGWPGQSAGRDDSTAVRVDSARRATDPKPARVEASAAQANRPAARASAPALRVRRAGTRDRIRVESVSRQHATAPTAPPAQAPTPRAAPPQVPVAPTTAPSAGQLTQRLGETTRQVTQGVGTTLDSAGAAPVGNLVRQTGDTTARSLPQLPLP